MGVGEGSVQNMGDGGEGGTTHKSSWTLCEQLVRSQSLLFYSSSFSQFDVFSFISFILYTRLNRPQGKPVRFHGPVWG